MFKPLIRGALLAAALIGTQGCFYSSPPARYGAGPYGSHTICDTNGNNCLACDGDNNNCQSIGTQNGAQYGGQYGPQYGTQYGSGSHTVCNDHGCQNCDSSNNNCQPLAGSSWGFFF
jgi:hypothetical protein